MKRNAHTPDEKAKMVLEALRGERTVNEIASAHNIHPNMLSRWKREAICTRCFRTVRRKSARKKRRMRRSFSRCTPKSAS